MRLGLTAFICTIALVTVGCGSGEDAAAPQSPKASTDSMATSAAAAAALQGVAVDVRRDPG
jgi:hypothetical protein